jgi:hypothetical protein
MQSDQEFLQELARDAADGQISGEKFRDRATLYLAANPHLSGIAWVNSDGIIGEAVPLGTDYWTIGEGLTSIEDAHGYAAARNSGHPAYGDTHISDHSTPTIELFVPIKHGRDFLGAMVAAYPVSEMLVHLVPKWFLEKYHVSFTGAGNRLLAENSAAHPRGEDLSYSIKFDPPGNGMRLRVAAFRTDASLAKTLPILLIVGLSLLVVWSLWSLRNSSHGAFAPRTLRAESIFARRWKNPCPPACVQSTCTADTYVNAAFCNMVGHARRN